MVYSPLDIKRPLLLKKNFILLKISVTPKSTEAGKDKCYFSTLEIENLYCIGKQNKGDKSYTLMLHCSLFSWVCILLALLNQYWYNTSIQIQ